MGVKSLQIRVLGDFRLMVDGAEVVVAAQKTKALLAWLVCHPAQPQPRDRLAGLLWSDRSDANARASLRQAVAGLRRLLPEDALVSEGEYLSLRTEPDAVDLDLFRTWSDCADSIALKAAIDEYRGDLLDGFHSRSESFDEWLLLEREAIRREALGGLTRLMDVLEAAGERSAAVEAGGRLLTLDPLQEAVHRRLMSLYAEQGQFGSAQRQFKLCKDALARELDVPPAPETVAVFRALGDQSSSGVPESAVRRPQRADTSPELDRRAALPSIAVLPFRTLSSVTEHEYLADGMTEELINLLTNSANWRVVARNLVSQYREQQPDIRTVGAELGVGYAVEGSIRAMGDRVRISVALISTSDGTQIWSDRYDRPLADLFDVQDEVVHSIFRTLKNRLGFAERERVRRTPKTNLDAWSLLIKAMQVNVVDAESHKEQLNLVREALEIEPNYPRAHAYLASLLFIAVGRRTSPDPKSYLSEGGEHMEHALDGGPQDTVVLRMCAGGFAAIGQSKHAMSLAERAFEISGAPDPLLVAVLMWNGRIDEALQYCEEIVSAIPEGVTLPPGELRPLALLGNLHMLKENYSKALELTLQDQKMNPGNYFSHINVANLHGLMDQPEEAAKNWALATAIVPSLTVEGFSTGYSRVFAEQTLADKFSEGLNRADLN